MQEYLPKEAYKAVTDAIEKGTPISREIADLIANGMKSWAKSLNVTHYTHWFQPLTDGTAEKHDGFIEFGEDGGVIEYRMGRFFSGIRSRYHALYPYDFYLLHRRSAGLQDSASESTCRRRQGCHGCLPAIRQERNTRLYQLRMGTGIFPRRLLLI